MLDELKEDLVGIDIRFDEPLKRYTYTKVGGPADYLAFPRNRYELSRIVKFANKHDIPWMVLGNASNLIVRDGGIRGFVIMFDRLNGIAVNGYQIEAEAGANLIATTKVARFQSLTGFEFAAGIPGSVGGAVFMNAGAYGGEIAHILVSAQVLTKDGDVRTIDARDMRFGYRRSVLQETGEVVISAKFNLKPGDYEQIKNEMNRLNHLRELKQPLEYPSCGSVFKRPPGHFAGQLIVELISRDIVSVVLRCQLSMLDSWSMLITEQLKTMKTLLQMSSLRLRKIQVLHLSLKYVSLATN